MKTIKTIASMIFIMSTCTMNAQTWSPVGTGLNDNIFANSFYINSSNQLMIPNSSDTIKTWNGSSYNMLPRDASFGVGATCIAEFNSQYYVGSPSASKLRLLTGSTWSNVTGTSLTKASQVYKNLLWAKGATTGLSYYNGSTTTSTGVTGMLSQMIQYKNDLYVSGAPNGNAIVKFTNTVVTQSIPSSSTFANTTAIAFYNDTLYAGGMNTSNGKSLLAKWNGSSWIPVKQGSVSALCVFANKLYIASSQKIYTYDNYNNLDSIATYTSGKAVNSMIVYGSDLYIGGTFTDINGDASMSHIAKFSLQPLYVFISSANVICNGGNDGSASANVTGGTMDYTYSWSNGSTSMNVSSLVAGTYTVVVSDGNSSTSATTTISEPSKIVLNATSINESATSMNDGSASVSIVSGGIATFTYSWNNSQSTSTAVSLTAGTYSVTVTDANGCSASTSVVVSTTISTGIESFNKNVFNVYPNPFVNEFSVTLEKKSNVNVVDVSGRVVYSEVFESGNHNISLNTDNGVYFLMVNNQATKIIKQ